VPGADVPREVELRLTVDSSDELEELERVLLKARATELAEVRRQDLRYTAGYGDTTSRDVMGETGRTARLRYELLTRLIEAIRAERGTG
jgi:hypothetical protein